MAVNDRTFDRIEALLMQRELLEGKAAHIQAMIAGITRPSRRSGKG